MNELIAVENFNPLEIFTPQGTADILERIAREARANVVDISTKDGRANVASLAYKIAKSKTLLDDMGKELVAEWKEKSKLVDAERKRIRDTLDELKEEIRAPLTEWENKEKDRVAALQAALLDLETADSFRTDPSPAEIQARIDGLAAIDLRDWQEFTARAAAAKEKVTASLTQRLEATVKAEAERAELERLRAEDAERKRKEHEERIAAEAAAKAKADAEAKAKADAEAEAAKTKAAADKAEQERLQIEREKEAAEHRARDAEAAVIAAKEKAKVDMEAAEARAKAAAAAAEERATQETFAAAQRERDRIEAEKRAEAEATAKREADKRHKSRINNEALAALVLAMSEALTSSREEAEKVGQLIVAAIAYGKVPHVKIIY